MASLTNPNPIDNTSPNRGADLDANFDICKSNDDALNAELATKANITTLSALETTVDERTEIQTGAGHAPAGTPVKMSWFEGTTNSGGLANFAHGLGTNILGFISYIQDTVTGRWTELVTDSPYTVWKFYTDTNIYIQIGNFAALQNAPYRILVFYK